MVFNTFKCCLDGREQQCLCADSRVARCWEGLQLSAVTVTALARRTLTSWKIKKNQDYPTHRCFPCLPVTNNSSGWWFEPLWKIWKSIGMISNPIYGTIKNVPNHQAVIIIQLNSAKQKNTGRKRKKETPAPGKRRQNSRVEARIENSNSAIQQWNRYEIV